MEHSILSYESGKSTFYVNLETPVPVSATEAQKSPVAPPRTRSNPFNKVENNPVSRPYSTRNASKFFPIFFQNDTFLLQFFCFLFNSLSYMFCL